MPTHDEVLATLARVLREQMEKPREIRPTDDIQNDLSIDSLGVMEVVASLEDAYHVEIPLDLLPRLRTVEQVADALEDLLAKRPVASARAAGGRA